MAQELEARMVVQVIDVALGAGEEIVDAQHLVALRQQPVDQVRAEEACATRDQDAFAAIVKTGHEFRSMQISAQQSSLLLHFIVTFQTICIRLTPDIFGRNTIIRVLQPDDVILSQILSRLHFDQHHGYRPMIGETVH